MRHATLGLVAIAISVLASIAQAEIYKTVDKDGRTTFTDTPPNTRAKPIEMAPINTTQPTRPIQTEPTSEQATLSTPYEVYLLAPENGATFLPNERTITIKAMASSPLKKGDLVVFKLDNKVIAISPNLTYTLSEPPSGEHFISVSITNKDKTELAHSGTANIVVMPPSPKESPVSVPAK